MTSFPWQKVGNGDDRVLWTMKVSMRLFHFMSRLRMVTTKSGYELVKIKKYNSHARTNWNLFSCDTFSGGISIILNVTITMPMAAAFQSLRPTEMFVLIDLER